METSAPVSAQRPVNNAIYDQLGDRWYTAQDDPVALLRAESRHRTPWILERLSAALGGGRGDVLDVGCGAGFLGNQLAVAGHRVTGLDSSADSLAVAARHDATGSVRYQLGDAAALPYPPGSFDAVFAMDFLEHVEDPGAIVAGIARVLRPGGLFFFHTFSRTWLAWLVVIKGVEWFVRNTPRDLHVLRLFIRPDELAAMGRAAGLDIVELHGSRPHFGRAMARMLVTGVVPPELTFTFSRSTRLAYTGIARKRA